jgi:hypothetical protein
MDEGDITRTTNRTKIVERIFYIQWGLDKRDDGRHENAKLFNRQKTQDIHATIVLSFNFDRRLHFSTSNI